jgi:adenylate cyclase
MAQRDATSRESALAMAGIAGLLRWLGVVPWAVLFLALFVQWSDIGEILSGLRYQVFDYYQRTAPRPYTETPVRYIDIDEESLSRIGQWPWPRTTLAKMTQTLADKGVGVIAFDIVFPEPDRTSPDLVAKSLPQDEGWSATRTQLAQLPNNDVVFAETLKQTPSVLGFILGDVEGTRPPALKAGMANVGDSDSKLVNAVRPFKGATVSLDVLQNAAPGSGSFNTAVDKDGIVRRVPLFVGYKGKVYPGLALEALRVALRNPEDGSAPTLLVKMAGGGGELSLGNPNTVVNVKVGPFEIPSTEDGQMWIHYTKDVPQRRIPAWRLLEQPNSLGDLEGAAIFVGTSAPGLLDLRSTPVRLDAPGVEVHIQAFEQMLLKHFLERPDWANGLEMGFALLLGLIVLLTISRVPVYWIASVAVVAIVTAVGTSWWAFTEHHWLLDPIAPSLNIALVFAAASLVKFMRTEAERRTVRSAFAQYLPPDVVEQIAEDPSMLKLGGDTRELTIMFCDIRGFTPIAESFRSDPQGLTKLINRALTPLSREVLNHHGTIDKYIGDCVMAFWNAPLDDADHARHACECALAMMDSLVVLNNELTAEGFYEAHKVNRIDVSIGVNTGVCVVGNMGSDLRFDYSALGDAVNVSARIQSFAGNYGFPIAIGEDTEEVVAEKFAFLELDYLAVKGRATPTHIYALMGHAHVRETKAFQVLNEALQTLFTAFRAQNWAAAKEAIAKGRAIPGAPEEIFELYEDRIAHYELEPPPPGWDGAWSAKEK